MMDPRYSAQVLLHCDLCQKAALQSRCELCQINLCKACVGEHLSDSTKRHSVVPYKHRTPAPNYPKCPAHIKKQCELFCEKCDIPVCSTCISSGQHKGHDMTDVLPKIHVISEDRNLEEDLLELKIIISPSLDEIVSNLNFEKVSLEKSYENLTTAVIKQGEDWHRKINIIVNKQKSEIEDMKTKHLANLVNQEAEFKQIISNIKQKIYDLKMKKLFRTSEGSLTSLHKSINAELRSLPSKVHAILPRFLSQEIDIEFLSDMFGSLSALTIKTENRGFTIKTLESSSWPPVKPLLDEPMLITTIDTGYENLYSVTCLTDEAVWICGFDKLMKLYNLQAKQMKSIKTTSGNDPSDITVTKDGDLVYTDHNTRTVNIVDNNDQIQEVIKLQYWQPCNICSTSSGDFLVVMNHEDNKQSKVVRYSGSTTKQTIQFDDKGKPLYSIGEIKHITENRNLDICVADQKVGAVVAVNKPGKLRFKYTGDPSTTKGIFDPYGITTDSQSHILISDLNNHNIHILDEDGKFLNYINANCDLKSPCGLFVDSRDNLIVAERYGEVKKIKYM